MAVKLAIIGSYTGEPSNGAEEAGIIVIGGSPSPMRG
jgi:hypothetical protein